MGLHDLGYLTQQTKPCAEPKPVPHQITKDKKTAQKKLDDKAFRDLIWTLDEGKPRLRASPSENRAR